MAEKPFNPNVRAPLATLYVLRELLNAGNEETHAYSISAQVNRHTGTVVHILHRLEAAGWVTLRDETEQEIARRNSTSGSPRRYVKLTPPGRTIATLLLQNRCL